MNIIIPMAGHSRRFRAAGYQIPKAFIEIDGRPMIHWVVSMFSSKDHFIFVVQKTHMEIVKYRETLQTASLYTHIVEIEPHEKGPVYTALFAEELVKKEEPIIIAYCDFYQHWNYNNFLNKMAGYEGGMAVFRGFHPASFGDTFYAYIRTNASMEMLELREKASFTPQRHKEFASTGIYYLENWDAYKTYATSLLEQKIRVGSEYYVSLIYNPMVQNGQSVALFEVKKFICWGTPEDLQRYCFWSSFFSDKKLINNRSAS